MAAVALRRILIEEEERLTMYYNEDLKESWEFKIVRANWRIFHKLRRFQRLIEEEQRSGWIFLEKFDDSRVRFKRPRSAQANDARLISMGIDPYRVHFGMSPGAHVVIALLIMLLLTTAVIGSTLVGLRLLLPELSEPLSGRDGTPFWRHGR